MTVGVNERGALICEVKTALMDTSMKGSVRVLPGSPADDPLRLIRMTIGVKHLMRALTVTSHIPGVTLRCAMIPDHVMVISAVLTDEGGSITFFIPPLDRL